MAGAVAIALLTATAAGIAHRGADAQDTAVHPVVGTWQFAGNLGGPIESFAIFHADGTYIEEFGGTSFGVWRAVGDDTVEITTMSLDADANPNVYTPGLVTQRQTYRLNDEGTTLIGSYHVEVKDESGTIVFEDTFPAAGTRMEHQPQFEDATPTS
jgi:hypothetical protein